MTKPPKEFQKYPINSSFSDKTQSYLTKKHGIYSENKFEEPASLKR